MAKAKSKAKAKRYSDEKKKEILDFIDAQGRGGQTKAVKKFKVTAATIGSWRKKASGGGSYSLTKSKSGSAELKAVRELERLLNEIASTEAKLDQLRRNYKKVKAKL